MRMKLDHAQITVAPDDVDATLAFYEKVLGLERIPKTNSRTGGWFAIGDHQLHVGAETSTTRELNLASKRHVCFVVENVHANRAHASRARRANHRRHGSCARLEAFLHPRSRW